MRKIEKQKIHQRTSIREHVPRLNSTSDAPVKLILFFIFLLGGILVWWNQQNIAAAAGNIDYISPVAVYAMEHIFGTYITVGGIFITILIFIPLDKKNIQDQLRTIGFANHADMVPELKRKYKDKQNPRISIWEFTARGIPLKEWQDKQAAIETVLDINIVRMKNGSGKSRVLLYTVPARTDLPKIINWNPKFLSNESFILVLGESLIGPVTVNLSKIPHILLGGSTGSGKSVLLKLLLMQAVQKGARVYISDLKEGVDFADIWHERCRMCIDMDATLELLEELTAELRRRKKLFSAAKQPNIDRYNAATGEKLQRYIFACDEITEILDKTSLTKEQKEIAVKIEGRLSTIARMGRAFGIHLILATQRPDSNVFSGQIKNNINCRICGRADMVLSQIILDNTSAAELIPKDTSGRFLLHDGTVFQAYWFDDEGGWQ